MIVASKLHVVLYQSRGEEFMFSKYINKVYMNSSNCLRGNYQSHNMLLVETVGDVCNRKL